MRLTYKHTLSAAYLGYITQAAVNNLPPLLFTAFARDLGVTVGELSMLISVNFVTQLTVDWIMIKGLDRIGIRRAAVWAHIFSGAGFLMLGVLPFVMKPFWGLAAAMMINAVGGGLIEVVISPVVEALPGDEKASAMSMLHSFYCWGQVGVVLISTLFLTLAGGDAWKYLPFIWSVLPLSNALLFAGVPICSLTPEDAEPMRVRDMLKSDSFPLLILLMICAGASELAMSQWSSYFAETGLSVSKTAGDLLGFSGFALLMGCARLFYGIKGESIPLEKFIGASSVLCVSSYALAVFSPIPVLSLAGCALCGFSVGIMWPGTFSIAAKKCPAGGNAMFALLALAGDIGCTAGPGTVGLVTGKTGNFKTGLAAAAIFPLICFLGVKMLGGKGEE